MKNKYSCIVIDDFEKQFVDQFRQLNDKGWALFLDGRRVSLENGKVDVYPSKNAARDALDRNLHFSGVYDYVFRKHGYKDSEDKRLIKKVVQKKTHGGVTWDKIEYTDDYHRLREIARGTKNFLIRHWLKTGKLEIKEIK